MNDRMQIFFLIAGVVFVIGLFGLIKKLYLPAKTSLVIKRFFIFLCLIVLATFILSLFNVYFRGYWTTKILIWSFILTASLLYSFGNRQILTKPWQIFTAAIFYFPLVSLLLMVIPSFLGTIFSYALWVRLTGDPKAIYYNDNEIRIQKVCTDCDMGFQGLPRYFKKEGLFELDKGELDNGNNLFDNRIKVEKTKDSIIVLLYYLNSKPFPFAFRR